MTMNTMFREIPDSLEVLDHGKIDLIKDQYSDLTFVNAARVSFDKTSSLDEEGNFKEGDRRLLRYLIKHNHWTPLAHAILCFELRINDTNLLDFLTRNQTYQFRATRSGIGKWFVSGSFYAWASCVNCFSHAKALDIVSELYLRFPVATELMLGEQYDINEIQNRKPLYLANYIEPSALANSFDDNVFGMFPVTFVITAPISVRTQLFKSKIGFVENEVSRRYVSYEPCIHNPGMVEGFRGKPEGSAKQGSTLKAVYRNYDDYEKSCQQAVDVYNDMIENGICAEQARFVLPQGAYTTWWWTGYVSSYSRMYWLRSDPHAQKETRDYAAAIDTLMMNNHKSLWDKAKLL